MKKTFLKLLAGATMVAALGAGTSVMAADHPQNWRTFMYNLAEVEGMRIDYHEGEDGTISATPWLNNEPQAPVIVGVNPQLAGEELEAIEIPELDLNGETTEEETNIDDEAISDAAADDLGGIDFNDDYWNNMD